MVLATHGTLGWQMMLAFWVLFVALVIWAVGTATTPPQQRDSHDTARQILDERLARGEMDGAEHEERRQLLATRK